VNIFDDIINVVTGHGVSDWWLPDLKLNYGGIPVTFDSWLRPPQNAADNAALIIYIKQWLVPVSAAAKGHTIQDSNGTAFTIQEWKTTEWQRFRNDYHRQAEWVWDARFWLVPPAGFTALDTTFGNVKIRPNVICRFQLLDGTASSHHKKIEVVRLADSYYTHGADSSTFRSNAVLYDSLDTTMHIFQVPDNLGNVHSITHYTIPHELGHSLGMWHSGTLYKDQYCKATNAQGGLNSAVCYGYGRTPQIMENIMGYGLAVTAVNALPWQNAIGHHVRWNDRPRADAWRVVLRDSSQPHLPPKRL
jgi:hypothetical protein